MLLKIIEGQIKNIILIKKKMCFLRKWIHCFVNDIVQISSLNLDIILKYI